MRIWRYGSEGKALTAEPDDLISIPGSHMVIVKSHYPQMSSGLQRHAVAHTHTHTHTDTHTDTHRHTHTHTQSRKMALHVKCLLLKSGDLSLHPQRSCRGAWCVCVCVCALVRAGV